ncbi:MAG: hypothetical protein H0X26_08330 [Alphaproteobacteria bacterium]|nr:hypothetical protein [Alphaproteobacteria bacterium]
MGTRIKGLKKSVFTPSYLQTAQQEIQHLKLHKSFQSNPLSEKCPVLVFEHGIGVTAGSYQSIFQELVSHGYIVVVTHHPSIADTVCFQDGSKIIREAKRNKKTITPCLDDISFVLNSLARLEPLTDV